MDHLETISEEMTSPDGPEVEAGKPPVPIPASDYLEDFQYRVLNNQQPPTISTGFKNLDASLGGGIFPGFYVIGANSSIGKTTLTCQIADQIAVFNQDILIFSLEMSREELIAKSISRLSGMLKQNNAFPTQEALSTRQILNGIDLSDRIEMLKISFGIYKFLGKHIYIYEGMGDMSVETIRKEVDNFIAVTGSTPIVIIDYIQILAPHSAQYTSDKQNMDKTVVELKRLSRDKCTPIIGISSLNRQSYREPVTMGAFKESGGIEYGADVLIGLQLRGMGEKDFDVDQAKQKNPREVELKVLKNRNGPVSEVANFLYYPQFNLFCECQCHGKILMDNPLFDFALEYFKREKTEGKGSAEDVNAQDNVREPEDMASLESTEPPELQEEYCDEYIGYDEEGLPFD